MSPSPSEIRFPVPHSWASMGRRGTWYKVHVYKDTWPQSRRAAHRRALPVLCMVIPMRVVVQFFFGLGAVLQMPDVSYVEQERGLSRALEPPILVELGSQGLSGTGSQM